MKAAIAVLVVLSAIAACTDNRSHIYAGRLFDPARNCLETASSIDVVDGTDPGSSCEKKCIATLAPSDGGLRQIYVSSMCPPYPTFSDTTETAAGCDHALAASERSDLCLADGGTSHPPVPDAGPDTGPD